jgi:alpha-L-fucosidase 2
MKITRRKFLMNSGLAAVTLPFASSILNTADDSLLLWYDKPASEWTEALPIGNGRLGAMIFGGPATEQLQLNEDTLYAGSPYDPNNPEALKALPEARRLIFAGKYKEAHDLVGAKMMAQPITTASRAIAANSISTLLSPRRLTTSAQPLSRE